MKTTPAPERGAGSDDPIGRSFGQDRPTGHRGRWFVRTSFSVLRDLRFSDRERAGCAESGCAVATGGANAGRNQGRKRGLAPDPTGGAAPLAGLPREGGAVVVRFAVDAVCCGALGCRCGEGLLSVTVDGKERVVCPDCAVEFVEEELE